MRFFEEITAPEPGRFTDSVVHALAKKEILAAALLGSFPKHAPRFPTAVLAALENVVFDPVLGIVAVLSQGDFAQSMLTRSKTIGSDRAVMMGLVVICKGAFVRSLNWAATGWAMLKKEAAFDKNHLLPSPRWFHVVDAKS